MSYSSSSIFSPVKETTKICNYNHEWRPINFPSFLDELKGLLANINEACLFRGHRKSEWLLDSTFARNLKVEQGIALTQRYPDNLINDVCHQHGLAKRWVDKVNKIIISPQLESFTSQGIDPFYEYHRHLQQNPKDLLLNDKSPLGSNFIDFTEDWKVGLFFANSKRNLNDEGALFIVRQTVMGKILHRGTAPFQDTFQTLKTHLAENPDKMYGHSPLWIEPDFQINNMLDPKPKRQKAIYLAQMDLRIDLGLSWELLHAKTDKQIFVKLILPKDTHQETARFLNEEGVIEKYLFPKTIFDNRVKTLAK